MKPMKIALRLMTLVLVISLGISCSDDENATGSSSSYDRDALLANWADNYILPGFGKLSEETQQLETTVQDFVNDPNAANLDSFRESYKSANRAYQRIAFIAIGPVEESDFVLNLNTYPTDVTALEENVSQGSYELDLPASRDVKGFPALDYLLYEGGDQAVLQRFQSIDYQQYAVDVVNDINLRAIAVEEDWGAFRDDFVANNGSSSTASTDKLVNDFIEYYERFLRAGKLGIPLGVFSGNEQPQTVESYYNPSFSNELAIVSLQAHQAFFNGFDFEGNIDGAGLDDSLDTIQDGCDCELLSGIINAQFDAAEQSIVPLDNFRSAIEAPGSATQLLEAYDELQALVPLFKVDMVQNLSIAIDYVDADGD